MVRIAVVCEDPNLFETFIEDMHIAFTRRHVGSCAKLAGLMFSRVSRELDVLGADFSGIVRLTGTSDLVCRSLELSIRPPVVDTRETQIRRGSHEESLERLLEMWEGH
jgi:hypothetical protein